MLKNVSNRCKRMFVIDEKNFIVDVKVEQVATNYEK
jgi:hypothetical protein